MKCSKLNLGVKCIHIAEQPGNYRRTKRENNKRS